MDVDLVEFPITLLRIPHNFVTKFEIRIGSYLERFPLKFATIKSKTDVKYLAKKQFFVGASVIVYFNFLMDIFLIVLQYFDNYNKSLIRRKLSIVI